MHRLFARGHEALGEQRRHLSGQIHVELIAILPRYRVGPARQIRHQLEARGPAPGGHPAPVENIAAQRERHQLAVLVHHFELGTAQRAGRLHQNIAGQAPAHAHRKAREQAAQPVEGIHVAVLQRHHHRVAAIGVEQRGPAGQRKVEALGLPARKQPPFGIEQQQVVAGRDGQQPGRGGWRSARRGQHRRHAHGIGQVERERQHVFPITAKQMQQVPRPCQQAGGPGAIRSQQADAHGRAGQGVRPQQAVVGAHVVQGPSRILHHHGRNARARRRQQRGGPHQRMLEGEHPAVRRRPGRLGRSRA